VRGERQGLRGDAAQDEGPGRRPLHPDRVRAGDELPRRSHAVGTTDVEPGHGLPFLDLVPHLGEELNPGRRIHPLPLHLAPRSEEPARDADRAGAELNHVP